MLTRSLARQHAVVGLAEALDLAPLLGERLDHADAGDRVGQHAGHLGPDAAAELEAAAQLAADAVDQPGDQRQRAERDHGQQRIDPEQDAAVMTIISTSVAKSSR